ncbi:hypothetical protein [Streptomyces sp. CA-111067]|uniref:hypothetical protein n=1 Tax=Streptomyces sp. CA-111067 TaxID=3240046 RepID=UPI003D98170E
MGWFRSDRELAATKYAGRESATDRKARKEARRAAHRMGRPHRNAASADRQGWAWADNEHRGRRR